MTAQQDWFDVLQVIRSREHYSWLSGIPDPIERIVNFGCWSGSEPFALLWTLDANEIAVIEIEEKFLKDLVEQIEIIHTKQPGSMQGRTITYICCDMTMPILDLQDQYFDLAYCEDVLYSLLIQGGSAAVDQGIQQMIRVVKQTGFIVAVEPKYGVNFQTRKSDSSVLPISLPVPLNEPDDMTDRFSSKRLNKYAIPNSPTYAYCFQKGDR